MRRTVALFAVILAIVMPPLLAWSRQSPHDPRVGMSFSEVQPALLRRLDKVYDAGLVDGGHQACYSSKPDFLGNSRKLYLLVNREGLIIGVNSEPEPRKRPPWLDRSLKAIGW